ncbi:MAG TPA: hypothetical protein VGL39_05050 [Jatrophihabitantaceae bacterium]
MAEVVQALPLTDVRGLHQRLEPSADPIWRYGCAVLLGEHQAVVDVGVAPFRLLDVLAQLVSYQHADQAGVEVDTAVLAAAGLDRTERGAAVLAAAVGARLQTRDVQHLLAQHAAGFLEVDVGPPQAEDLATPPGGAGDRLVERAPHVPHRSVEELAEVLGLPRMHLGPARLG